MKSKFVDISRTKWNSSTVNACTSSYKRRLEREHEAVTSIDYGERTRIGVNGGQGGGHIDCFTL